MRLHSENFFCWKERVFISTVKLAISEEMLAAILPPTGGEGDSTGREPAVKGRKRSQELLNLFESLNPPLSKTSFS